MLYPSKKFRQNPFTTFSLIRRTDRQTNRHTYRTKNITSFGGGNYKMKQCWELQVTCDAGGRNGGIATPGGIIARIIPGGLIIGIIPSSPTFTQHSLITQIPVPGFLPICQNQIQGLFKDFQGPYEGYIRRTKLNQTGTFISIYKHYKLPKGVEFGFCAHLRSERSHLEYLFQYQLVQSRHFRKSNSRTFKDPQEPWV